MKNFKLSVSFIFLLVLLTACSMGKDASNEASEGLNSKEEQTVELSIGLMPAVDAAPILLAEKEGYYDSLGLDLNATIYTNGNNRQSALQTNELDGAMTDLIAFINTQQNGFETKIVTSTDGSFAFLVDDKFEKEGKKQLGIMEVSVSNYLADNYISSNYDVKKVYIPEIPARLEMLKTGQLDIGFFPEPIASKGELAGLTKLVSVTDDDGYMPEAMVFTPQAIKEKREAIKRFITGYNQAVDAINQDDTLAREVLIETINLDPEIQDFITLPTYHHARVPNNAYINKIINWIENAQGIKIDLEYEDMIAEEFTNS
ncbi:NMT1/THI5 like protein [Paraliobacillus sp. PM-2]|uniref:ABC transporter substrate-binding protein n=1 Tax=Paraliobacillus sp. PM-2 TaxID=1462524 RepID=UPI00061BE6A7|nr:ABC transporter substrate-binding protein [Paraliobacillus sp. PM-2]CQR47904.1 NMT1/THI5 like protein [Paraliobacillus sp. PM-2]